MKGFLALTFGVLLSAAAMDSPAQGYDQRGRDEGRGADSEQRGEHGGRSEGRSAAEQSRAPEGGAGVGFGVREDRGDRGDRGQAGREYGNRQDGRGAQGYAQGDSNQRGQWNGNGQRDSNRRSNDGLPNPNGGYAGGNQRYDRDHHRDGRNSGWNDNNRGWNNNYGRNYNRGWNTSDWRRSWNHGWGGNRYRAQSRYYYPRGHSLRSWSIGFRLPSVYYAPSYYVDYRPYGLSAPPYGCRWIRADRDVLLVDLASGEIVDILYGFYY